MTDEANKHSGDALRYALFGVSAPRDVLRSSKEAYLVAQQLGDKSAMVRVLDQLQKTMTAEKKMASKDGSTYPQAAEARRSNTTFSTSVVNSWFQRNNENPALMFFQRMRWNKGQDTPFDSMHFQVDGTMACVFYVKDGVSATIEEFVDVFPSDELIAKFKLITGG